MNSLDGEIVWVSTTGAPFARLVVDAYDAAGGPRPAVVVLVPPDPKRPRGPLSFLLAVQSIAAVDAQLLADPAVRAAICDSGVPEAPYRRWAVRVESLDSINSPAAEALLTDEPRYIISAGLPEIVSSRILALARLGAINVHNGALPEARGHFATFWEYQQRQTIGTVTVHRMTARVDSGPVLATAQTPLSGKSLLRAIIEKKRVGGRLLAEVAIRDLSGAPSFDQLSVGDVCRSIPAALPWPTLRQLLSARLRGTP